MKIASVRRWRQGGNCSAVRRLAGTGCSLMVRRCGWRFESAAAFAPPPPPSRANALFGISHRMHCRVAAGVRNRKCRPLRRYRRSRRGAFARSICVPVRLFNAINGHRRTVRRRHSGGAPCPSAHGSRTSPAAISCRSMTEVDSLRRFTVLAYGCPAARVSVTERSSSANPILAAFVEPPALPARRHRRCARRSVTLRRADAPGRTSRRSGKTQTMEPSGLRFGLRARDVRSGTRECAMAITGTRPDAHVGPCASGTQ